MAANTSPVFILTPASRMAQIATANANRDGTGTLGTVYSAGANGARIDRIVIQAAGTTTAGVVRLYVSDGTNHRLWKEVLVPAITPSTTVEAFRAELSRADGQALIALETGYSLRASTHNAETFNVVAHGGDY